MIAVNRVISGTNYGCAVTLVPKVMVPKVILGRGPWPVSDRQFQHVLAGIYEAANNSIRHRALCNTHGSIRACN